MWSSDIYEVWPVRCPSVSTKPYGVYPKVRKIKYANAKSYRSSCTRCAAIREPDAPRGWPTASAPPSTLVRSRGRPSSFSTAKYWAANACRQMEYCSVRVHRTSTYYEYIVLVSVENWVSGIRALCALSQWFSTWGTRVICDTLTQKIVTLRLYFYVSLLTHKYKENDT